MIEREELKIKLPEVPMMELTLPEAELYVPAEIEREPIDEMAFFSLLKDKPGFLTGFDFGFRCLNANCGMFNIFPDTRSNIYILSFNESTPRNENNFYLILKQDWAPLIETNNRKTKNGLLVILKELVVSPKKG